MPEPLPRPRRAGRLRRAAVLAAPVVLYVYVANTGPVVRFPYCNGDTKARGPAEVFVASVPGGGQLRGGGHRTRDIAFSKDGRRMFASAGSRSNVTDDGSITVWRVSH